MVELSTLQAGYAFPVQSLTLDAGSIGAYLAAVEDTSPAYQGAAALVPPLAVVALAMRGLTALLARQPGAIHASQRLTMQRAIPVGATVQAYLGVQNRSERRGFAALTLEIRVEQADVPVILADLLLLIPLPAGNTAHG
jgi:acyl dehydratase